ncbi:MAG: hypothetical protein DRH56_10855 [Deltaproteobacteria bacterium]|nr:MAG: hypothetical protein DRH56_10855 [Deltaproteobacteria bacterium]
MGKKQATGYAANPGGIRRIFARIRKVLTAIRNGLAGKGFRDPAAVFGKIWTRAYSPAPVARGDRTAIAFGGRGQMSLFSMAGERPQPAAPHTRFSVLNEEADVPDSGPGLTAELKKNRTFVNKLFEMSDLARHRIGVETAKLQEQVQKLAGKASRRKLTLGFAYKPDLKRSMASDQLDRAMMVYRDLQANPEKADEFKAWADRKLSDPKTPGKQKIVIRRELKLLDAALALTPEQKAFVDEMARRFEDGYELANKSGLIRTHRDHYVRRIWRLPAGKEDLFQGTGSGYGFKTFTTAAKERSFDTILDGWMNGYELAVAGITNSYYAYMTELATVMANRAFIRRGVATKDLDGNPMFSTDPLSGYKPLKAAGFSVWRWKGMAAAEAKLDDKEALIINTYGRKFFATIPERVPEMWAVYKDADAKRALKLFDD